jgi:hypothetical protein
MVLEDLNEMNASSCHEVSGDCSHHAGSFGPTHVARFARPKLRFPLMTRVVGGVATAWLCGLLVTATAAAQESVLSEIPLGPSIGAPQQTIEGDGYPAGSEWNQGGEFVQPNEPAAPGDSFADQSSADSGQEFLAGQIGAEPTIEGSSGEYIVGDLPKGTCCPGTRCPRWTAQVDALFLWQTNIPSRVLFIDKDSTLPVLNANEAVPAVSVGPRYALIYHRDACRALEINYFQVQSFAGAAAVGEGGIYEPFNLPGGIFEDVLSAQVATSAGIKSLEFNLRKSNGGVINWIAGFRWVEWNQQMSIVDQNEATAPGAIGIDTYQIDTGNNLYGGQVGADMMLWNASRAIKVNGVAKGGIFYNHQAYQTTTLGGDQNVFDNATLTATDDAPSFVGEVGVNAEYALTNWLSWRAGYTLFWLAGVATPANQLSVSQFDVSQTGINSYSSVLLHGVTTGLEARW